MIRKLSAALLLSGVLAGCGGGAQEPATGAGGAADVYIGEARIVQTFVDSTAYGLTEEGEAVWAIYFDPNNEARGLARGDGDDLIPDGGTWSTDGDTLCFENWEHWPYINNCFMVEMQGNEVIWEAVDTDFWNRAVLVDGNPEDL